VVMVVDMTARTGRRERLSIRPNEITRKESSGESGTDLWACVLLMILYPDVRDLTGGWQSIDCPAAPKRG
jgi:hypothetical protein